METKDLSLSQLEELMARKKAEHKELDDRRREAYDDLKNDLLQKIKTKLDATVAIVAELQKITHNETSAFYDVMREYGALTSNEQRSFSLQNSSFKIEIKSNSVKGFDERADIAAGRLLEFLEAWIKNKGGKDPMYKLAMTLLERNRYGDLDYKSISKLYELESEFNDACYSEIMQLFKESNVVSKTAVNYYFHERTTQGGWRKIEPSFNRL